MDILNFNLSKEEYGLDIASVYEVLKPQDIHPLPNAPDFVEGVINIREHIVAVIDLKKKLNIGAAENTQKTRIIICRIKNFVAGLIVDSANEVLNISKEQIESMPGVISEQEEDQLISSIARIGDRMITLLNLEKVLTNDEAEKFSKVKQ